MSSLDSDSCPEAVKSVLHSNEPLYPADSAIIRDYLHTRQIRLDENRAKLKDITEQLALLMEQQDRMNELIAKDEDEALACEKRLATSISALPTEILEIVFSHSLPATISTCTQHAFIFNDQPPFSLTQVCSRWRKVALHMPTLWIAFSLRSFRDSRLRIRDFSAFKEMVKMHYDRAPGLPKSLDLYLEPQKVKDGWSDLTNPASAVFVGSHKIVNLSIGSSNLSGLLQALGAPSGWWSATTLDAVESLVLYSDETQGTEGPAEIFSPERLPSLRRLCLRTGEDVTEELLLQTYPVPWSNLSHIAITSWILYREWVEYFPNFSNLAHAVFYIKQEDNYDPSAEVIPVATFLNLVDLTLIFRNDDVATISFPQHKYPVLSHFRLGAYEWDRGVVTPAFNPYNLGRTSTLANLTSLSLHHLSWEAPAHVVVSILSATKGLLQLTLGLSTNYDAVLEHFQVDWEGYAMLPRLVEFAIDCTPTNYGGGKAPNTPLLLALTSKGFTNMVKDRWRPFDGISQLKKAALYLMGGYETLLKAVVGGLKEEVAEGLLLGARTTTRTQWEDPFSKSVTHWHEGLVLPPNTDCGKCKRLTS